MKKIEIGTELLFPQANTLAFRVLRVIDLPDGTIEADAYHIPHQSSDQEIFDHFEQIRSCGFMRQYQAVQTQRVAMPEVWYQINYIMSLSFPSQVDAAGAEWIPPYPRFDCEPFIVKPLN
ncbi:hypothetical protein GW756_05435 [bacterium]|nr:hypothetical protein [bacterium]NCQ55331.1 hypothetical protein [Candidatus Parcubacteria bacterium]NCS67156.1 hypothetical protein [Candidatus Peregrinibacteria bacterium]NCS96782.1 hypothetical protein [bacterium]